VWSKILLMAAIFAPTLFSSASAQPAQAASFAAGGTTFGRVETLQGKIIDLDILIGEYPGNAFGAWLLIEKKGAKYPTTVDPKYGEQQVLPVFQVRKKTIATKSKDVPFSTDAEPWVCHQ